MRARALQYGSKAKSCLLIFCMLLSSGITSAQDVSIRRLGIPKAAGFIYVGALPQYHVYVSTDHCIYFVDKNNADKFLKVVYKTDVKREFTSAAFMIKGYIYLITRCDFWAMPDSAIPYKANIYKLDPLTGQTLQAARFGSEEEKEVAFNVVADTMAGLFAVFRNGVKTSTRGLELEEVQDALPQKTYGRVDYLHKILKKHTEAHPSSGLASAAIWHSSRRILHDTSTMRNYKISHTRNEAEDVYFFKEYISDVMITPKAGKGKQGVRLELEGEKTIIDMAYKPDPDQNLLIYGKYRELKHDRVVYGLFSCKYDQDAKPIGEMNYYYLFESVDIRDTVNHKYFGLVFSYLPLPNYTFNMPGYEYVMTYQSEVYRFLDHIYILKLKPDGELEFNMISNKTRRTHNVNKLQSHAAVSRGDSIFIVFYERKENMKLAAGEVNLFTCEPDHLLFSVLSSCVYHAEHNTVGQKKPVKLEAELETHPELFPAVTHMDPVTGRSSMYIQGYSYMGKKRLLYELLVL